MESGSHEDAQAVSEDDYVQRENGTFASCDLLGIFCICAHYCTFLSCRRKVSQEQQQQQSFLIPSRVVEMQPNKCHQ